MTNLDRKVLLFLVFLSIGPLTTLAAQPDSQEEEVERLKALFEGGDHRQVIKEAKKLTKAIPGCFDCHLLLARSFNQVDAFKDAFAAATKAVDLAGSDEERGVALTTQGLALYAGGQGDRKSLNEAELIFRKVAALTTGSETAAASLFNLGLVLLKQEKDQEGVTVFKEYLKVAKPSKNVERAQMYIDEPRRARVKMLPDFSMSTLAGEYLDLDSVRGKIVLFDFWGTWCAPCLQSVPHMRSLAKRSAKDPFVIISVSNDRDGDKLRRFIAENGMTWHQVWDEKREIVKPQFEIESFPTFLLADHEGVVIYSTSGWSDALGREINATVSRAIKKAKEAAKASPGS